MTLASELTLSGGAPDFAAIPEAPGVFLVWPERGPPYVGRTSLLRRRLERLLRPAAKHSRLLNLAAASRVEYQPAGSAFESMMLVYGLSRRFRPEDYQRWLKLRPPVLLKVNLSNVYPRCYLTRRTARDGSLYFGPFSTRAAAERFQNAFLDLFLVRRCREEILPDPAHPGCVYGEMQMCLRPCQAASTQEQYGQEVARVTEFLSSRGASLLKQLQDQREQASARLEFEQAARLHHRLAKAREALDQNEDLARDLERLDGAVIQRSAAPGAVEVWLLRQGFLQPQRRLQPGAESLDGKLRELMTDAELPRGSSRQRGEHLALLLRWHSSSWRQGELVLFDDPASPPYRKLVRAVSRTLTPPAATG